MNRKIVIANEMARVRAKRDALEVEKRGHLKANRLEDAQVSQLLILRLNDELFRLHLEYNFVEA